MSEHSLNVSHSRTTTLIRDFLEISDIQRFRKFVSDRLGARVTVDGVTLIVPAIISRLDVQLLYDEYRFHLMNDLV